jgi:hypothetical protein
VASGELHRVEAEFIVFFLNLDWIQAHIADDTDTHLTQQTRMGEISGSYGSEYEGDCLLGYCAV